MGNENRVQEDQNNLQAEANSVQKTNPSTANSTEQWFVELIAVTTKFFEQTTLQTQHYLANVTASTGAIIDAIAKNPIVKILSNNLGTSWLEILLGGVNIEQVQKTVQDLQKQYPQETSSEIAHRLMVQKSIQAAGIGLATNFLPPLAVALFAIDLVTTTRLQAEMTYEIAAAYGLDLNDPIRRGEVLAIFGLSLGSSVAIQTGLEWVEIIPGLGAVIGASSNAILLYGLGYIACRFYETKLHPQTTELTVQSFQQESQDYWKFASHQQQVMDQILAQMILASYPDKSKSDLIPELEQAHLSPEAIKAISTYLETPISLENLLEQLHPDFVTPLLVQCERIAQIDGEMTPAEQAILDAIAKKRNRNGKP
ncbi:hypothetical protein PCC9214_00110 [Planktothrix tepida]|uniref:Co-chaperone DjlA N-terminal domain-containing protein n=1 Tax=Planktothrix tepida PCC 9214 TaxID=671072 RepID=A0A1J1LCJ5_9CYAN|nr:TerB family tellurite resistance protein [Planktothrix tepida]CAD5912160.1 hypothetical protein PCC9214_00110 [Planktothrix tepida]CUR30427.1 conserved hypothetical protein [Planktothrix tepida PCC 9214]